MHDQGRFFSTYDLKNINIALMVQHNIKGSVIPTQSYRNIVFMTIDNKVKILMGRAADMYSGLFDHHHNLKNWTFDQIKNLLMFVLFVSVIASKSPLPLS